MKSSIVSGLADDTSVIFASKELKIHGSGLNSHVKLFTKWLNADTISLNVEISKLLIFQPNRKQIDYGSISIKLNGYKFKPSEHVKYLYIDAFLDWDHYIKLLGNKLSRTNGILSKPRHYCPKDALINV